MDVDDQNDNTGDVDRQNRGAAAAPQDAGDEIEMLDETEQDEFQAN